jgi:hypothetical protein
LLQLSCSSQHVVRRTKAYCKKLSANTCTEIIMLRCAKIVSVDYANANDKKLIRCHGISCNANARALLAVKFDGISETRRVDSVAARRRGQEGAIASGRQRERASKEGGCSQGRKGVTNMTFAPGRQKPWRRHWV